MSTGFDFKKYLGRVVKYLVYLVIVFALIIAIFSLTSNQTFSVYNLFRPGTGIQIAIFLFVMSVIYPFFGYATKKVYLNKGYEYDKKTIQDIFLTNRYKIECEGTEFIKFRHKSAFVRTLRMFEDTITLDFSDNPIKLEGQRKDVYRMARMIEYAVRNDRNDE
ncbi:MAG: hypothetical protein PHV91_03175 [Bacteroidales bacterium]|jgi:hypothetical protein|nr:hypothetical protein [Bacteroidales bacterium]MDD3299821.1 hypothetical protein [Bacteroidales bacterium]MDD3843045.1 hypothetical protein [Bacteroidales bacterium]MDD4618547.1 hypothetical protein [Bacteroidales bacterium]